MHKNRCIDSTKLLANTTDGLLWLLWSLDEQIWRGAAAPDDCSGRRQRQPPALRQRHASWPRSRHQERLRVSQGQSAGPRSKASDLQSAHPACQHRSQSEEPRWCRYKIQMEVISCVSDIISATLNLASLSLYPQSWDKPHPLLNWHEMKAAH